MPVGQRARSVEGRLESCLVCGRSVPLRLPQRGEAAETWECVGCGTVLSAVLISDGPAAWRDNVRRVVPLVVRKAFQSQGTGRQARPTTRHVRPAIRTDTSKAMDRDVEIGDVLQLPTQGPAFRNRVPDHGAKPYDPLIMSALVEEHGVAVVRATSEYDTLFRKRTCRLAIWHNLATDFLRNFVEDPDLFVCLGINPAGGDYPARHGLHASMLAMAMGVTLGLDEETLVELGIGCLLHDAGMQCLNEVDVMTPRRLAKDEMEAVAAHPMYTFELLRGQLSEISDIAKMVAYQIHERCNGAGYPAGRMAHEIHPAAKIAAVADAFTALCSPRSFRPAMIPYYAMTTLLEDVREGYFDARVVRALLQTVSLFPVGSGIDLGGSLVGRVLRSNSERYDRPVVEAWDRNKGSREREIINLAEEPDRWQPRPLPMAI